MLICQWAKVYPYIHKFLLLITLLMSWVFTPLTFQFTDLPPILPVLHPYPLFCVIILGSPTTGSREFATFLLCGCLILWQTQRGDIGVRIRIWFGYVQRDQLKGLYGLHFGALSSGVPLNQTWPWSYNTPKFLLVTLFYHPKTASIWLESPLSRIRQQVKMKNEDREADNVWSWRTAVSR